MVFDMLNPMTVFYIFLFVLSGWSKDGEIHTSCILGPCRKNRMHRGLGLLVTPYVHKPGLAGGVNAKPMGVRKSA